MKNARQLQLAAVPAGKRRGFLLLIALAALTVATLLFGIWVRASLAAARAQRLQEHRLQAEWIAQSALGRAAAQLRLNRKYKGETWQLSSTDLSGRGAARVTIGVNATSEQSRFRLDVRATYPTDGSLPAAYSKTLTLDL